MKNLYFTEKTIENAFIPSLSAKYELALNGANFVVTEYDGTAVLNSYLYEIFKTKILAVDYLKLTNSAIITDTEYEQLNNRTIFDKLKKFAKSTDNKTLELKAKKIIADFNLFLNMLDTEINNELNRQNNIMAIIDRQVKQITPENIESLQNMKDDILSQSESFDLNTINKN